MGGSFNPHHERHVEMAQCARKEYKLDRVIFLPTGNPPHKHEELADAEHRYEMTRLSVFGLPAWRRRAWSWNGREPFIRWTP